MEIIFILPQHWIQIGFPIRELAERIGARNDEAAKAAEEWRAATYYFLNKTFRGHGTK